MSRLRCPQNADGGHDWRWLGYHWEQGRRSADYQIYQCRFCVWRVDEATDEPPGPDQDEGLCTHTDDEPTT
jgi:hypothetical protein